MLNIFKTTKEAFFSIIKYELEESDDTHEILAQSRIDKETAENMEGAMKIIYKNDKAHKIIEIEEGEYIDEEEVRYQQEKLNYRNYPINNYQALVHKPNGIHQLGGRPPQEFKMPDNITTTPNIYLGKLNCKLDDSLKWTNLDEAHLVCPIHSDFELLYYDYSSPLSPVLISETKDGLIGSAYDDLKASDQIIFNSLKVGTTKLSLDLIEENEFLGNTGAPAWIQQELIPKCPKSGNSMKFLAMLDTNTTIEIETSDVDIIDESMRGYFESYNFWCDGALFIFYEPESKIMAYFIQNT